MTLQEFKAWFEGFTEGMRGVPSEKQWGRIKARVGEIDGVVTTERIYVDRYWPSYWSTGCSTTTFSSSDVAAFNANSAMTALGQSDAADEGRLG
jgi:hypothetical protein